MITLTDNVTTKVSSLIVQEKNDQLKLRVYVTGGGCSGFQYGFKFDENTSEDDTFITKDGITVLVDSTSIQYLEGSTLDFTESLTGSQFVIQNPNAKATCGCGSSFTL